MGNSPSRHPSREREQRDREEFRRDREDFRKDREEFRKDRDRFMNQQREAETEERERGRREREELRSDQADFRVRQEEFRKDKKDFRRQQRDFRDSLTGISRLLERIAQQAPTVEKARADYESKQQILRASRSGKQPTAEEIEVARKKLGYKKGYFHFAVAGSAGCGKSSIINAARGKGDHEKDSAKTGIIETTKEVSRYPDNSSARITQGKFVWYDVPGCDTLDSTVEQYFNTQGLYIFDAVVVAVDRQMSASTIAIIKNCISWDIPWYLVRSKADQHIDNLVRQLQEEQSSDSEDEDEEPSLAKAVQRRKLAQSRFIDDTRAQFNEILNNSKIPSVEPYIISSSNLRKSVKKQRQIKGGIDEWKLIQDLVGDVFTRRIIRSGERREYHDISTNSAHGDGDDKSDDNRDDDDDDDDDSEDSESTCTA